MQWGALGERLPRLRYVVVSTASGAVGSIVGKIIKVKGRVIYNQLGGGAVIFRGVGNFFGDVLGGGGGIK